MKKCEAKKYITCGGFASISHYRSPSGWLPYHLSVTVHTRYPALSQLYLAIHFAIVHIVDRYFTRAYLSGCLLSHVSFLLFLKLLRLRSIATGFTPYAFGFHYTPCKKCENFCFHEKPRRRIFRTKKKRLTSFRKPHSLHFQLYQESFPRISHPLLLPGLSWFRCRKYHSYGTFVPAS